MPPHEGRDRRTYLFTAVLGQGGFGRVYRASMEASDGFRKEVAVKLMNEENMPADALVRFGDEARILGLIRDRAIVSVDSPTRLNGRLAVVMEYVDGASAAALLKNAPFPATVALEIIQEVARVLDKVVQHPGPDGRPLNLLHRDLKPGNLQITPGGEVKVLDFGIARATFDAREARTMNVTGTPGYMAPERMAGEEGPAGDIYSLGVVLQVLVTGDKAVAHATFRSRGAQVERTPEVLAAVALAEEMWSLRPSDRPTARQVEDRCQQLRQAFSGITLRSWAETHVPASRPLKPDELIGVTFTEMFKGETRFPSVLLRRSVAALMRTRRTLVLGSLGLAMAVGAGTAAVGVACGLGLSSQQLQESNPVQTGIIATTPPHLVGPIARTEPVVSAAVFVAPPPIPAENTLKEPPPVVPSAHVSAAPPPPVRRVVVPEPVVPEPVVVAAVVAPSPAGPVWTVTFASVPGGAIVLIDGASIGTAPVLNHELASGTFEVRMVYPTGESIVRTINTGSRQPVRYVWDQQGGGTWNSY